MANRKSRYDRRIELGFHTYEDWSRLNVREMDAEADKVFAEANRRLRSLRNVRKYDVDTLPAMENLKKAFEIGSFSTNGKKAPTFKTVAELPRHELQVAYRAALEFVTSGSSDLETARRMREAEKSNIANTLKVSRQIIDFTYGEDKDFFYSYSYIKDYGDLTEADKKSFIIEKKGVVRKVELKPNKNGELDILSAVGYALNEVKALLNDLGYTTSPGTDNGSYKNETNDRFVDVLAGYLFFKGEEMSFAEIVQAALDEYLPTTEGSKQPSPNSDIGKSAEDAAKNSIYSRKHTKRR